LRRLLVVEDETPIQKICVDAFEPYKENISVDTAGTIASARALLASNHYHVVICDGILPDGSGVDLAQELHNNGTPVVFISGTETGPSGIIHLKKPFRLHDLISIVGGYLP